MNKLVDDSIISYLYNKIMEKVSENSITKDQIDTIIGDKFYTKENIDAMLKNSFCSKDELKSTLFIELRSIPEDKYNLFNFKGNFKLVPNESSTTDAALKTSDGKTISSMSVKNNGIDSYPYFYLSDVSEFAAVNPETYATPEIGYYKIKKDIASSTTTVYSRGSWSSAAYIGKSIPLSKDDINSAVTSYSGSLRTAPRNIQLYCHFLGTVDTSDIMYSTVSDSYNSNGYYGSIIPNNIGNGPLAVDEIFYFSDNNALNIYSPVTYNGTSNSSLASEVINHNIGLLGHNYTKSDKFRHYYSIKRILNPDNIYLICKKTDRCCNLGIHGKLGQDLLHDVYLCDPVYIQYDTNGNKNPMLFHGISSLDEFIDNFGPLVSISNITNKDGSYSEYNPKYPTITN